MEPKRILIVEDDPDAALLLQITMEEFGYEVEMQYDGSHVLDRINQEILDGRKIDLILLDLYLPGLYGIQIARKLRESPKTMSMPIILVTVVPRNEIQEELKVLNIEAYFRKPANMNSIAGKVNELLAA